MTAQKAVSDDVLGALARRQHDMFRRVCEGGADPKRALEFVQWGSEAPPEPVYANYLLESYWSWDHSHHEFATISFEECDGISPFEDLLKPDMDPERRRALVERLKEVFRIQVPDRGKMVRLYRIRSAHHFGCNQSHGIYGELTADFTDLHFALEPICEFDDRGNPVPCMIRK